jgi:hypothetical protein
MEASEGLRRAMARFFEAIRDGDEEAVKVQVSGRPGLARFGSDAAEVWADVGGRGT